MRPARAYTGRMKRRFRPLVSVLAVLALLFAQAMVAVHACDMQRAPSPVTTAAAAPQPAGDCCTPADVPRDPACGNHCQQGDAIGDTTLAPAMGPAIPAVALPSLVAPPATAPPAPRLAPDLSRDTEPPIAVRHCCFRI